MATPTIDEVLGLLRASGGRVTSPRRAILTALFDHGDHPTADQITAAVQARHPDVAESTVYRFLEDLRRLGVIGHVHLGHRPAVYHFAEDTHHHLVCQSCDRVIEIPDQGLATFRAELRATHGFELQPQHFALSGHCRECAATAGDG